MATIELKPGWDKRAARLRTAIVVRLTDLEAAELRQAAAEHGTTVSALVRGLASSYISQYPRAAAQRPARARTK